MLRPVVVSIGFKTGVGYRFSDALLVTGALDIGRMTVGMAYGWSIISADAQALGRRTFELMVQLRTSV